MRTFTLYGTSACHLCDVAREMLTGASGGALPAFAVDSVDIADSEALFARYGVSIPVLRHPDGRELAWPFDAAELRDFLAS